MTTENERKSETKIGELGVGGRAANGKSLRTGWAGTWGVLVDGRSKIGRRRKKIEKELTDEYRPTSPLARRRVRRAAELMALGEMTVATMGTDPKSTRRALTALQKTAEGTLAPLRVQRNGHDPDSPSLRELLIVQERGS